MVQRKIKIFVRNPEKGKVKTRLAASVGDEQALSIYLKLLHYTKEIVLNVEAQKEVWYSSFIDEKDLWANKFFTKKKQEGQDLGMRMKNAFQETFFSDKNAQVVLIGSDCAELKKSHIIEAFNQLNKQSIVIGPAKDGGYYLIGMSKYVPEVFEGIDWSTSNVLKQTIGKINESGKTFYLLKELSDIDTIEDWVRIKKRFEND